MYTRFYFIRHAEAHSNVNPLHGGEDVLTEKGLQQAKSLAARFKDMRIDAVYTSKVLRAQLTAKEIEKVIGVTPVAVECLKEQKGVWKGDAAHLEHVHTETYDDLRPRLLEARKFLEQLTYKHVVVVSHAFFLKALAGYLILGDSLTEETFHKFGKTLTIDNTAISKFLYNREKDKWHLESWNDQVHLT